MGKKYFSVGVIVIIGLLTFFGHVSATYSQANYDQLKYKGNVKLEVMNFPFKEEDTAVKEDYKFEYTKKLTLPIMPEPEKERVKVKGIFITGWVAGLDNRMNKYIELTRQTEINSFVIDIKDDTGYVSYLSSVPEVKNFKSHRKKIKDIKKLIKRLKEEDIYVIGRVVTFKDPVLAKKHPERALKLKKGDKTWPSPKWLSPYQKENWDYAVNIAKEALDLGFDEIQFDYVRFPALGNGPKQAVAEGDLTKEETIASFLKYAREQLAEYDVLVSADIFGLVTSAKDDVGIGQKLESISEATDVISPMVYPSHYYKGAFGLAVPDKSPYKTIYHSMNDAIERLGKDKRHTLRPWLQDFSLGHDYGVPEIREQIKALTDLGIEEWLFWNPRSRYTEEAFLLNSEEFLLTQFMESNKNRE